MGDRTNVNLWIIGPIHTVEILDDIVDGLENWNFNTDDGYDHTILFKEFVHAVTFEKAAKFQRDEANYGSIDEMETLLQEYGITYYADHGTGDEYGPFAWMWEPPGTKYETMIDTSGDVVISAYEIENVIANNPGQPMAAIQTMLENHHKANGKDMGKTIVSEEVKRHLAKEAAVEALQPEYV